MSDWLDVLSGYLVTTAPPDRGPIPPLSHQFTLRIDATTGSAERFATPPSIGFTGRDLAATTLADWTTATVHVAARRPPPLVHLLVRDARTALIREDYRRAIIDAATAGEVALAASIRERISESLPPVDVQAMIGRRKGGLMELYDFRLASVGPIAAVSWSELSHRLAGVRNDVAHVGHRPSSDEARAAIDVASRLVNEVSPLTVP